MKARAKVGVRELRQNLSVYLRRVEQGESLEVTDRGRPVAVLSPLPEPASGLEDLIAAGLVTPPRGDIRDVIPPKGRISDRLTRALEEVREDRL